MTGTGAVPVRRVLLAYTRPYRGWLAAAVVLSLLTSASGLVLPLVARALIGRLTEHRPVVPALVAMTGLVVLNAALGGLGGYLLRRSADAVVRDARFALTSTLLRLRIPAFDAHEPGDLMSRVTADTTLLGEVTTDVLVGLATGGLTLVATLVVMGTVDLVLLGVTLLAALAALAVLVLVMPRIRRAGRRAQEAIGRMGAALERALGALRTVKAAGAEGREEAVLHRAATDAYTEGLRSARWSTLAGNVGGLSIQLAFITVLGVGGARVATGAISIGTLVAFLLYVFYLMFPIQTVVSALTQYQTGAAAVRRIQDVLGLPTEPAGAAALPPATGPMAVTFEDVRFRYADWLPDVHRGVSFEVPAGGMTALVGPSGAGKTTVFSLLERFVEPTGGRIRADGRELAGWPLGELRAAIGYVEQDAPVLSGSLRENLLVGSPGATEAELLEVLARTRLAERVAALPDGLDSLVGHRGTRLSGGERQRLAIARALLRRPRLLLLDEATSQLDALNEAALRDTIADVAARTTVVVVAHRLSTVTLADRIVVLDAGRVRAVGRHDELVAADTLYAELAATQLITSA